VTPRHKVVHYAHTARHQLYSLIAPIKQLLFSKCRTHTLLALVNLWQLFLISKTLADLSPEHAAPPGKAGVPCSQAAAVLQLDKGASSKQQFTSSATRC
jgi:hypothetical protein